MASRAKGQLQYRGKSKKKFESYFVKPKAKCGRPKKKTKKRKRGRPRKVVDLTGTPKQMMMDEEDVSSLLPKDKQELDARITRVEPHAGVCEIRVFLKQLYWCDKHPHGVFKHPYYFYKSNRVTHSRKRKTNNRMGASKSRKRTSV